MIKMTSPYNSPMLRDATNAWLTPENTGAEFKEDFEGTVFCRIL